MAKVSNKVYVSRSSKPPVVVDQSLTHYCTVKWHKTIEMGSLPTRMNPVGHIYHYIAYEIAMSLNADGSVSFRVYFDGKQVDQQQVKVESQ